MEELTRIRAERGWSQQRLADEAGVNKATINQIERGRRSPNVETLEKLADALDAEVADFFPKAQAPLPLQPPEVSAAGRHGADERRRAFVQRCRRYAESRAESYEISSATLTQGGGVYAGPEGARILFVEAFEEYDALRPLFGRDLAYLFVEGLSDYEALRFSGLAGAALRPLAETVERLADRAAELAETEAQKAEVERRREEMRRSA